MQNTVKKNSGKFRNIWIICSYIHPHQRNDSDKYSSETNLQKGLDKTSIVATAVNHKTHVLKNSKINELCRTAKRKKCAGDFERRKMLWLLMCGILNIPPSSCRAIKKLNESIWISNNLLIMNTGLKNSSTLNFLIHYVIQIHT